MKILVIDDNKDTTDMIKQYLTMEGFDVTVSNDGKEGFEQIKNGHFDKIILDLAMPEFTGVDILNSLKDTFDLKKIHVFTASSMSKSEIEGIEKLGINPVIKKPIDMPKLVEILTS